MSHAADRSGREDLRREAHHRGIRQGPGHLGADQVWRPSQKLAALRGGRLRMALQVADTRELLGWVLSFGRGVRVLRPDALRETVRDEARRIVRAGVTPSVTPGR